MALRLLVRLQALARFEAAKGGSKMQVVEMPQRLHWKWLQALSVLIEKHPSAPSPIKRVALWIYTV